MFFQQYQAIPGTDVPLIEAATEYRSYKKGELLFKTGKIWRELFLVCSGILRIMVVNEAVLNLKIPRIKLKIKHRMRRTVRIFVIGF